MSTSQNVERGHPRRVRWMVGLVALLTVGAGVGFYLAESSRIPRAARRAAGVGRYAEASELIERWLKADPRSSEAHYLKARVSLALDRPSEVVAAIEQARALGQPEADLGLLRALIAAKQSRFEGIEPILARAFAAARSPDAQLDEALAKLYIETLDFARAEPVLARWVVEAPHDPKPYLWRAEVDRRKNDGPTALIGDYVEALKRDASLDAPRLALAETLRVVHRCAEAALEYDAYLARKPDDPVALFGRGRNALELGDEAAARRDFDRVLEIDPRHAPTHEELAEIHLRRGENAPALAHLDRAAEVAPGDVTIRYSRSLALSRLGRADDARAELATVARLRDDEVKSNRLQKRLMQNPTDLSLQREVARWMFEHGHADDGIRWATKALRDHPGDPEAARLLVDHYDRAGNPGLANFYRLQIPGPSATSPRPGTP